MKADLRISEADEAYLTGAVCSMAWCEVRYSDDVRWMLRHWVRRVFRAHQIDMDAVWPERRGHGLFVSCMELIYQQLNALKTQPPGKHAAFALVLSQAVDRLLAEG
jgi:hypothetical protein